ncbi:MAG TPA: peptidase M14 [Acidiferrobacteraceae bacterium]|nr:peptidase M14 [Acidiferrobacteraceae bacterium]
MLRVVDSLPQGFVDVAAVDLYSVVSGPSLIHLSGRHPEPLFVSVLLHGNETTGLTTVQRLLKKYRDQELPRAISLFVGNVEAARQGMRRLPGQPDYNRIWSGGDSAEQIMAQQVLREMQERQVFACVDIHNNTGLNPHYAIVSHLDHHHFQMATLFGRTVVYATTPVTTCNYAFAGTCPAVTLESGLPGQAQGEGHVFEYLEACMRLSKLPDSPVAAHDMDLFHTVATVKIPQRMSFGFSDPDAAIRLIPDIDRLNFREVAAGTLLAELRPGSGAYLEVWDENGNDAQGRYFTQANDQVRTARAVMPSMLTMREDIIRMDCLCYLMERMDWQQRMRA